MPFSLNEKSPLFRGSKRLISLWEMLTISGAKIWATIFSLEAFYSEAKREVQVHGPSSKYSTDQKNQLRSALKKHREVCTELQFSISHSRILHLEISLISERILSEVVASELHGLRMSIVGEASNLRFVLVPPNKTIFFEKDDLFGWDVFNAFPSAREEIRDGGNCMVLGLHSAAVFHFMRVVEFGLRALARNLNVKVPNKTLEMAGWDEIIQKIDDAVGKKLNRKAPLSSVVPPKTKGRGFQKKEADRQFYRGVLHEFYGFKDIWRNYVMHTRARYNEAESIGVYTRVQDFMERLSVRVKESNC